MAEDIHNGAALVGQAKQQAQQVAGQAWGLAQKQFRGALNGQKERAATAIGDVAGLIRQAGDQLGQQGTPGSAQLAAKAAERIDSVASLVREKEVEEIVADTEAFARQQPVAFLSIAAILGFVLARFLKSSGQAAAAPA